jgi:hypothetical protein
MLVLLMARNLKVVNKMVFAFGTRKGEKQEGYL